MTMDFQYDDWTPRKVAERRKRLALSCMRRVGIFIAALCAMISISTPAIAEDGISTAQAGRCDIGPLNRTFGMTQWLVYSCTSDLNVVIVSAPGNPASPFVFVFFERDGKYELNGEGSGDKKSSEAAFDELKSLSEGDIAALIEATKAHHEPVKP